MHRKIKRTALRNYRQYNTCWAIVVRNLTPASFFIDMVDIDLFKKILEKEDEGYITNGDFIPFELFDLMSKYNEEKRKSLFVKQPKIDRKRDNYFTYNVEIKCQNCGKTFVENMVRTRLFNLIKYYKFNSHKQDLCCKECAESLELEQELQRIKCNSRKIFDYIREYLNPNNSWDKDIPLWKRFQKLRKIDNEEMLIAIEKHILKMPYREFLKTPYWKAISLRIMKKSNFRCSICNSNENLNVHHITYEHHGMELYYMEDLVCLCKNCHENYHGI